jgi:Leucine-rich repeat (LRR) protein
MARNKAYRDAELKIEQARETGATELNLSGSRFGEDADALSELPETLSQLTSLETLNISANQLTGLPEWIGRLHNLQTLDASFSALEALPESLGGLKNLRTLDIANNRITSLPESFYELTQLHVLNLGYNEFSVLPNSLATLTKLQELRLDQLPLTALPEWLGEFELLTSLTLSHIKMRNPPKWIARLSQLQRLDLVKCELKSLPEWLSRLGELSTLNLSDNEWGEIPQRLKDLPSLSTLHFWRTNLETIPPWFNELRALEVLNIRHNSCGAMPNNLAPNSTVTNIWFSDAKFSDGPPRCLRDFANLEHLEITESELRVLPEWIGDLAKLKGIWLGKNKLEDLPTQLTQLKNLTTIELRENPLNSELDAAYREGFDSVIRYLRAKAGAQVALNEAKLILVGEGEVGKSSLLSALRDDQWEEGRPTTHGIEIKTITVTDPNTHKGITLNGWDFGGQRVYRPTHQLFFSAPAIYLVVWKPREGPQQGLVKEWISLIEHRAPEAKILIVATHGGPKQRQPDIDRQEIWDLFGRGLVVDFFLVESKPDEGGVRIGLDELRKAIGQAAANLPEMGRLVPKRWEDTRQALKKSGAAYLSLEEVLKSCKSHGMDEEESADFIRISHRLGHLIHYEHDPLLQDIVVLKPDWLSTAISFVLDDEQTRENHGLVSFERLGYLWNDPKRIGIRYPSKLHPVFLRLMERYDLSYRVAEEGKLGAYQV